MLPLLLAVVLFPSAARARPLEERLLERIVIDDRGDPAESAELRAQLRAMLKSPTARRLAERLLQRSRRTKITLAFTESLGGRLESYGGDKWLDGTNAITNRGAGGVEEVKIDQALKGGTLPYRGIIAHELFGHVEPWLCVRGGPLEKFYGFSAEDELRAELIGGVVDAELGEQVNGVASRISGSTAPLSELFMWDLFDTGRLLLEDLPRSRRAYFARAVRIRSLRAEQHRKLQEYGVWRFQIEHLIREHGFDRRAFEQVREDLAFYSRDGGAKRAKYEGNEKWAREMVGNLDEFRDWIPGLAKLGRSRFVREQRADTVALRERLRALVAKNPKLIEPLEPPPKRAVPQLTWDEIAQEVASDRILNPDHYAGEPAIADEKELAAR